ncbi:uncharacterized protein LAJ45_08430 [Morchella importuna]|uniref:uncharacterized protein n=1 Tax=Morchella importuna TaxID=1174673 RepID=UPI001E8D91F6|nr:uncharacterized protein LAJ45_08430 [Morchella importuna]KAH8147602.1 hypothetical protein LAJ45_08430 [Morchella importuna]
MRSCAGLHSQEISLYNAGERGSKIAASKITAKYIETCVGADVADLAKIVFNNPSSRFHQEWTAAVKTCDPLDKGESRDRRWTEFRISCTPATFRGNLNWAGKGKQTYTPKSPQKIMAAPPHTNDSQLQESPDQSPSPRKVMSIAELAS